MRARPQTAVGRVYRVRILLTGLSVMVIGLGTLAGATLPDSRVQDLVALSPGLGLLGLLTALAVTALGVKRLPLPITVVVRAPVTGRWLALNSPETAVPSHGVRGYGQAYAIDLVHEPADRVRPAFGGRPAMRAPQEFPAFGEPVAAMIDGKVVRVRDAKRDHLSRSNLLGFAYMMLEGPIREAGGPGCIVGNHVTIRSPDGIYALVAHLQQGSALVREGDAVHAGQVIGRCGNSGNSSEPHVHAQLMDRASLWTAVGLPMTFEGIRIDEEPEPRDGLPGNNQHMVAGT